MNVVLMSQRPIAAFEEALSKLLEGAMRASEKGDTHNLSAAILLEGIAEVSHLREQVARVQGVATRERDCRMAAEDNAREMERERDAAMHAMVVLSEGVRRTASIPLTLVAMDAAPLPDRPLVFHYRNPMTQLPVCDRNDPNSSTTDVIANVTCGWCQASEVCVRDRIIAASDANQDPNPADVARLLEIEEARSKAAETSDTSDMGPLGVVDELEHPDDNQDPDD